MTSTSKSDFYQPLATPRSIRLLSLDPSTSSTKPLTCRLQQVVLEDVQGSRPKHTYEALSYVWGARHGTMPITCDRQTLLVTPNCESALRHLRWRFSRRFLWIDAICIDQNSLEEKSTQVPLMSDIYSSATRVILWLGPGVLEEENLLRHARISGHLYHVRGRPADKVLPHKHARRWASKYTTRNDVDVLRRICSNAWFMRMWTIQELLLASSAVFQIGRTECPTTALYNYLVVAEAVTGAGHLELPLFEMRNRLLERLNPKLSWENKAFLISLYVDLHSAEANHHELLAMLWRLASLSDSADIRDKVYGMFGLLRSIFPSGAALPAVDYDKPIEEILEEATWFLVWETKSLWPLEMMAHSNSNSGNLPSWVPDLRKPDTLGIYWHPHLQRYADSDVEMRISERSELSKKLTKRIKESGYKHVAEMTRLRSREVGQLPVKARYLAEVAELYTRMPTDGTTVDVKLLRAACLSEWASIAATLDENRSAGQNFPGSYLEALGRMTPGLDYLRDNKNSADTPSDPRNQPADIYDGAVLFRTCCGLLGLCKGPVRLCDGLWQLAGGRYPFMLHQGASHEAMYCLVGIADLQGPDPEQKPEGWRQTHVEEGYRDVVLL